MTLGTFLSLSDLYFFIFQMRSLSQSDCDFPYNHIIFFLFLRARGIKDFPHGKIANCQWNRLSQK